MEKISDESFIESLYRVRVRENKRNGSRLRDVVGGLLIIPGLIKLNGVKLVRSRSGRSR